MQALEQARHGISLVETETPTAETKITRVAPMLKWGAGIIGISAEVLSAIGEKIACGRESLKNYLRAVEIDPKDYYIYFSIARYHWEIYRLPSLMKWSANRISTTPFDSSTTDVLEWLKKA